MDALCKCMFIIIETRAARYWKKLTLQYFVFLQYILRYGKKKKKKKKKMILIYCKNKINDWGDFIGE